MSNITLKPVIMKCNGGWQGLVNGFDAPNQHIFSERGKAYDNKQEAWDSIKLFAKDFARSHNDTCRCNKKMIVGSY